jgi:hypothetical protein
MNKIVSTSVRFKKFALLYSRVGAGAGPGPTGARAVPKYLPGAAKNYAAPQH